jgi:hypothetical protein
MGFQREKVLKRFISFGFFLYVGVAVLGVPLSVCWVSSLLQLYSFSAIVSVRNIGFSPYAQHLCMLRWSGYGCESMYSLLFLHKNQLNSNESSGKALKALAVATCMAYQRQ